MTSPFKEHVPPLVWSHLPLRWDRTNDRRADPEKGGLGGRLSQQRSSPPAQLALEVGELSLSFVFFRDKGLSFRYPVFPSAPSQRGMVSVSVFLSSPLR